MSERREGQRGTMNGVWGAHAIGRREGRKERRRGEIGKWMGYARGRGSRCRARRKEWRKEEKEGVEKM